MAITRSYLQVKCPISSNPVVAFCGHYALLTGA